MSDKKQHITVHNAFGRARKAISCRGRHRCPSCIASRSGIAQTQAMVRIDSINTDLEAGAAGEGELARYVAAELTALGYEPIVHEVRNTVART